MAIRKKDLKFLSFIEKRDKKTGKVKSVLFPHTISGTIHQTHEGLSYLVGQGSIVITSQSNGQIVLSGSGGGGDNFATNVGAGTGEVFRNKTGATFNFKTLVQGTAITITNNADDITIATTAQANDGTNLGSGAEVFESKVGVNLRFRTLLAGTAVNLSQGTNEITINAEAADPGAAFVLIGNTASLPNERALTAGAGIDIIDGGANSTVTVDFEGGFVGADNDWVDEGHTVSTTSSVRINETFFMSGANPIATFGGGGGDAILVMSGVSAGYPLLKLGDGNSGPEILFNKSGSLTSIIKFFEAGDTPNDSDFRIIHTDNLTTPTSSWELQRHDGTNWREIIHTSDDTVLNFLREAQGAGSMIVGADGQSMTVQLGGLGAPVSLLVITGTQPTIKLGNQIAAATDDPDIFLVRGTSANGQINFMSGSDDSVENAARISHNSDETFSIDRHDGTTWRQLFEITDGENIQFFQGAQNTHTMSVGATGQSTVVQIGIDNGGAATSDLILTGASDPNMRMVSDPTSNTDFWWYKGTTSLADGTWLLRHDNAGSFLLARYDGAALRNVIDSSDDTVLNLLAGAQGTATTVVGSGAGACDFQLIKAEGAGGLVQFLRTPSTAASDDHRLIAQGDEQFDLQRHDGTAWRNMLSVISTAAMTLFEGAQSQPTLTIGEGSFEPIVLSAADCWGDIGQEGQKWHNVFACTGTFDTMPGVDLQFVTDNGNTTTNDIILTGSTSPELYLVKDSGGTAAVRFAKNDIFASAADWKFISLASDNFELERHNGSSWQGIMQFLNSGNTVQMPGTAGSPDIIIGTGAGTPNLYLLATGSNTSIMYWLKENTLASTGDWRVIHDTSERFSFDYYNGSSFLSTLTFTDVNSAQFFAGGSASTTLTLGASNQASSLHVGDGTQATFIRLIKDELSSSHIYFHKEDTSDSDGDWLIQHQTDEDFAISRHDGVGFRQVFRGIDDNDLRIMDGAQGTVNFEIGNSSQAVIMRLGVNGGNAQLRMKKASASSNEIFFYDTDETDTEGDYKIRHDNNLDWFLMRYDGTAYRKIINVQDDNSMFLLDGAQAASTLVVGTTDQSSTVQVGQGQGDGRLQLVASGTLSSQLDFFKNDTVSSDGDHSFILQDDGNFVWYRNDGAALRAIVAVPDDTSMSLLVGAQGTATVTVGNTSYASGQYTSMVLAGNSTNGTPELRFIDGTNYVQWRETLQDFRWVVDGVEKFVLGQGYNALFFPDASSTAAVLRVGNSSLGSGIEASLQLYGNTTNGRPEIQFIDSGNQFAFYEDLQAFAWLMSGTWFLTLISSAFYPQAGGMTLGTSAVNQQWNSLYLTGSLTAPGTPTGGIVQYKDTADDLVKIKHNTGNVATIAHDVDSEVLAIVGRQTTQTAFSNTTAEQTYFSYAVPANAMGTNGIMEFVFVGDVVNGVGDGSPLTITMTFEFGGSDFFEDATLTIADEGATDPRIPIVVKAWFANQGSASAQAGGAEVIFGKGSSATAGDGNLGSASGEIVQSVVFDDLTVATTSTQTFAFKMTMNVGSTSTILRRKLAYMKLSKD